MRGFYYEVAHNCNPFRVTKALFKRSFRKFPEQLLKLGYIKNKIAPKCNFYLPNEEKVLSNVILHP